MQRAERKGEMGYFTEIKVHIREALKIVFG